MNGHTQVADLLRTFGGALPDEVSSNEFCAAAASGDIPRLRMLHSCGVDPNGGDYDSRTALHLAAAEGKILAVSFLLGVSAAVDAPDRWGSTPLDDALNGGTFYHMLCAKMIQAWGGELGTLAETEEGAKKMDELSELSMRQVSSTIKDLLNKGLGRNKPVSASEQEIAIAMETNFEMIQYYTEVREKFDSLMAPVEDAASDHVLIRKRVQEFLLYVLQAMDSRLQGMNLQVSELYSQTAPPMLAWFEALGVKDDFANVMLDPASLEEHYRLYEELDELLLQRERAQALGKDGLEKMAKQFNKYLMQLDQVEHLIQYLTQLIDTLPEEHVSRPDGIPMVSTHTTRPRSFLTIV